MPRKGHKNDSEPPESERVFRYWVEIRELTTGEIRELPLTAMRRISLAHRKGEPPIPSEDFLELKDGQTTLEAKDLEGLKTKLRRQYPDETYVRTLHSERDLEAERRRRDALNGLVELLVEVAVREVLEEEARSRS